MSRQSTKTILVSWIGGHDLDTAKNPEKGRGPIRTLLDHIAFNEIHLLCNYPPDQGSEYIQTLVNEMVPGKFSAKQLKCHQIQLIDPTDYSAVFNTVDAFLSGLIQDNINAELSILLSPGTPAMTAIWVLLGKSRYPARFYQTYAPRDLKANQAPFREQQIPFDLVFDFVSEVLGSSDSRLEHLTSQRPSEIKGFEQIVGDSEAIRLAVGRARRAALRNVSVLLNGESGTGKELFARALHKASPRWNKKFVAINCAAMPKDLLEAELFGYEKGAFTGATQSHPGAFEQADEGILFLDEVGECDPALQAKLLRVLQPPAGKKSSIREIRRIGAKKSKLIDVRVIAATNRNLMEEVAKNKFREDLYYRLAIITIRLPALRTRSGDIALLAREFVRQINAQFSVEDPSYQDRVLSARGQKFVNQYDWPGNVRQLYNTLLQAVVMAPDTIIDELDIVEALGGVESIALEDNSGFGLPLRPDFKSLDQNSLVSKRVDLVEGERFTLDSALATVGLHYIELALEQAQGNKSEAARFLGLNSYQTFDSRRAKFMKELNN